MKTQRHVIALAFPGYSVPAVAGSHSCSFVPFVATFGRGYSFAVLALLAVLLVAAPARAELKLASVFGDNMVLQRDMTVPVWGSAEPGDEITVTFAGQTKTTKADASGSWQVTLDPLLGSAEPRDLVFQSAIGNRKSKIC
ncbi:hypothetical protein HQ590_05000, partial [bacterium]|nr:hypothetical protein [bacterium]